MDDTTTPNFDDVAAMLREEINDCHAATRDIFVFAREPSMTFGAKMATMKTATQLMKATAAASLALRHLYGSDTRHTVTVDRPGETPSQNPKTNGGASA